MVHRNGFGLHTPVKATLRYEAGQCVPVWYDLACPERAVLELGPSLGSGFWGVAASLVVALGVPWAVALPGATTTTRSEYAILATGRGSDAGSGWGWRAARARGMGAAQREVADEPSDVAPGRRADHAARRGAAGGGGGGACCLLIAKLDWLARRVWFISAVGDRFRRGTSVTPQRALKQLATPLT